MTASRPWQRQSKAKRGMEMPDDENKIILYTTDDGKSQVSLMSRDGRIWLNQKQMAELFAVSKPNISMLIAKIFAEKELDDSVIKSYLTTAADGKRYNVVYYALEMILAIYKSMKTGEPVKLPLTDFASVDMKGTF